MIKGPKLQNVFVASLTFSTLISRALQRRPYIRKRMSESIFSRVFWTSFFESFRESHALLFSSSPSQVAALLDLQPAIFVQICVTVQYMACLLPPVRLFPMDLSWSSELLAPPEAHYSSQALVDEPLNLVFDAVPWYSHHAEWWGGVWEALLGHLRSFYVFNLSLDDYGILHHWFGGLLYRKRRRPWPTDLLGIATAKPPIRIKAAQSHKSPSC